jgi:HAD superfamily hydrolase (TIGR01509 family)
MSKSAPRVVCFDLGGVLVRICRSWDEAITAAGLPLRDPNLFAAEHTRAQRYKAVDRYQRGELETEAYYAELARATMDVYTSLEVKKIHAAFTLKEYPGALELVRELNEVPNVVTACLSNTNAEHWLRLAGEDGRAEYPSVLELRCRVASHLLGSAKPEPVIFRQAQAVFFAALAESPSQILFFDDAPENVLAAQHAGWTAYEINPHGDTAAQIRAALRAERVLARQG